MTSHDLLATSTDATVRNSVATQQHGGRERGDANAEGKPGCAPKSAPRDAPIAATISGRFGAVLPARDLARRVVLSHAGQAVTTSMETSRK